MLFFSAQHLHSDAQPSSTLSERSRTDDQSSQLVAAPLFCWCCAHSSAASERAASYTHRVRPWVPRWPSGLSTQQPYETISVCPSDLLLALDAPSAGVTGTVVYDAIRTHTRSQNTCNVKSGRLPVHLGLDHAADMPVCLHLAPPLPGGRAGLPSQI